MLRQGATGAEQGGLVLYIISSEPNLDAPSAFSVHQFSLVLVSELERSVMSGCCILTAVFVRARLLAVPRKRGKNGAALAAEGDVIPKRYGKPAETYFITSRAWQGRVLFLNPKAAELFVATMLRYQDSQAYQLHAFVLMPQHFHLLVTPSAELSLECAVQLVKGGFAHAIGKELGVSCLAARFQRSSAD